MKKSLLCGQVERRLGNMLYSLEYNAETGEGRLLVSSDAFGEKSRKLYSRKLSLGKWLHRSQLEWVLGSYQREALSQARNCVKQLVGLC